MAGFQLLDVTTVHVIAYWVPVECPIGHVATFACKIV